MPVRDFETRSLETGDGITIVWYDSGGDKPPIVFANGLGGPLVAWRHQIDYLRDHYRLISWDYRGLYRSTRPRGHPPALDIGTQTSDLELVLAAANVQRAAFIGWSMGVQVILEHYSRRPESVSHLVLINGTFGRPFETVALPMAARVVPALVRQAQRFQGMGTSLLKRLADWPETVLWMKRLGLFGATLDEDLFREIAAEFATMDLDVYLRTLKLLGDHDAAHVLETIRVPTLVISGDRDAFTPRQLAQLMARRVAGGEILVVRGASHYAAIEYPELVNLRIEKFFREHGY